ncbi:MAG: 3-deoxy-D-manno-octulosonic acid transferase [Gammaproteobacteria bacterium]|nr:3-deoxy-D-manno-octulosonic acid transferase [Gammaproteobacteria bacterium]
MQNHRAPSLSLTLSRAFYFCVLELARPFIRTRLWWRSRREPGYADRVTERYGDVSSMAHLAPLWIHAVSAGETIAAVPLIEAMLSRHPDVPILVTSTTATGSSEIKRRLGSRVLHAFAPYDFEAAVKLYFRRVKPRALVLIETELWPNLLRTARQAGIPVVLVNGRLSERSAKGYGRIAALSRDMLQSFSLIGCQSETHRERFIALGAPKERVQSLGSVKYDVKLDEAVRREAIQLREQYQWQNHPVFIAASTHPGEEEQVLDAWSLVRSQQPDARLMIVPRHPPRADEVCALIAARGLESARQSRVSGAAPEVVVGDVMGSLLKLYGVADAAFVGGSLVPRGGHNPIEPALWGVPFVTGPHTFNFADVMNDFRDASAVVEIGNATELKVQIAVCLAGEGQGKETGERARVLVDQKRGALERTLAALEPVLFGSARE